MRVQNRLSSFAALALTVGCLLAAAAAPSNAPSNSPSNSGSNAPTSIQSPPATQPLSAEAAKSIERVRAEAANLEARPLNVNGGGGSPTSAPTAESTANGAANPALPKPGTIDFSRIAAALAIVVALIIGARLLFKHFFAGAGAPATSRAVKVIGRTAIAPRQQVLLIQIGSRIVVAGESSGVLSTLAQIEEPDEVARLLGQLQDEQIQRAASFGGLFGRMQKKYDEDDVPIGERTSAAEPTGEASAPRTQAAALEDEHQLSQAKSELSGLVDKVRSLRSQMGQ